MIFIPYNAYHLTFETVEVSNKKVDIFLGPLLFSGSSSIFFFIKRTNFVNIS